VLLANQPDLLQALHENLRGMMQHSPVMDAKAYVREVEQAYEQVWQQWLMN
jgi:predicted O-linked N-acetylglucosamine transferase (SPINDLY family)